MATVPNTGYIIPKRPSLAGAAAGASDPFGLASGRAGLFGLPNRGNTGSAAATAQGYSTVGAAQAGQAGSLNVPGQVKAPTAATVAAETGGQQNTGAPTFQPIAYDIHTDPAYQTAVALTGKSDEQARADAQKQIRDYLLAYGDPNLAGRSDLGGDQTLAQAAANNPTSTVHQLKDQYTQGLDSLDQALNQQNLTYSGYRIKQDKQAATDYQNALAQAAAGVNGNIGQVQANLNGALDANAQQRAQAEFQAEQQAAQIAMQNAYNEALFNLMQGQYGGSTGAGADTGAGAGGAGATQTPSGGYATLASPYALNTPGTPLTLARAAAGKGRVLF